MTIRTDIDRLGYLNEQIKDLQKQQDEIKRQLKKAGVEHADGLEFHLDVVEQVRTYLDQDAVKAALSRQFIQAHTRKAAVKVFKVSRKQEQAA